MRRAATVALWLAVTLSSCLASAAIPEAERDVATEPEALDWAPASPADVPGYWISTRVEGPMAAVVQGVVYLFRRDGSYTGAALLGADRAEFQVVEGSWSLVGGAFRLDAAPPATLERADGRLRLAGAEGTVVLRREPTPFASTSDRSAASEPERAEPR